MSTKYDKCATLFLVHFRFCNTCLVSKRSQNTEGCEKMPELLAVFVVTVLGNIVSGLILDWIHSKHNNNALEGQISFLKNQKLRSFLRCFTPGFSFVMRKYHHSYSSLSLKESWLNRIFKLSLVQHTWLKQSIPLVGCS